MNGYLSNIVSRTLGKQDPGSNLENVSLPAPGFADRLRPAVQEGIEVSGMNDPETKSMPPAARNREISFNDQPVSSGENAGNSSASYTRSFVHTDVVVNHVDTGSRPKALNPVVIPEKRSYGKQKDPAASRGDDKPEPEEKSLKDPVISPVRLQYFSQEISERPNLQNMKPGQKDLLQPAKIISSPRMGEDVRNPKIQQESGVSSVRERSNRSTANLPPPPPVEENISPAKPAALDFRGPDFPVRKEPSFITRSDPAENIPARFKAPEPRARNVNKLVIGKISVEVLPPPAPSVKTESRPANVNGHFSASKPASTPRYNLRFGLGQI